MAYETFFVRLYSGTKDNLKSKFYPLRLFSCNTNQGGGDNDHCYFFLFFVKLTICRPPFIKIDGFGLVSIIKLLPA